jgi:prevent-host-death family protein
MAGRIAKSAHRSLLIFKKVASQWFIDMLDWSLTGQKSRGIVMNATTVIAASEAKARFSELLERARKGEGFAITLHGEEVAKLVPAKERSLKEVQTAIAEMKSKRMVLNPSGKPRLRIKDLIDEGRP